MKKNLIHLYKKTTIVAFLILLLTLFQPLTNALIPNVYAGQMTSADLTISDSRASATAVQYDFDFTTTVTTSIKQLTIVFCTTASGACTTPTGMTTTGATRSTDNLAGTGRTDDFTGNGTLTTVVTTPATQSTQAVEVSYTGITNQSSANTTFFARITTYSDTGSTTIDSVTVASATLTTTSIAVSATVDPTFTFTVAAVNSGGTVNGATTNITTTANTIPFGTLSSGTPKIAAHDVTVTTNAANGYNVTVKSTTSPTLVSGSNNIDEFTGTNASPTTWSSPAGTAANVNSGFFGYTTEDATLCTGTAGRFATNNWAGSSTTAAEVICSATGTTSSGQTTRIGWQTEINGFQPQGSYTGTVILVATPTY